MNRSFALFNVDTQQPAADGSGIVFRPRVEPIAPMLDRLLRFAREHDVLLVWTACVNAGPLRRFLGDDTLYVGLQKQGDLPPAALERHKAIYLEKGPCLRSPDENLRMRTYDLFHANPNAERILRRIEIPRWIVFGDSVGYCIRTTVEGLLRLGRRVTLLTDAIGPGTLTEAGKDEALAALRAQGAELATAEAFLREPPCR